MERKKTETTKLWPRFMKVRRAIQQGLTGNQTPGLQREVKTFSWNGADSGIHDHSGILNGKILDMELNLSIKGTTAENNPEFTVDEKGNWHLDHKTERHIEISGHYASPDGMDGIVRIDSGNGNSTFEAYWLKFMNKGYRLEQIVTPKGVFDAEKLSENRRGEIEIPGTRVTLKRMLPRQNIKS